MGSFFSEIMDDMACLERLFLLPDMTKAMAMLAIHTVERIHIPVLIKQYNEDVFWVSDGIFLSGNFFRFKTASRRIVCYICMNLIK